MPDTRARDRMLLLELWLRAPLTTSAWAYQRG